VPCGLDLAQLQPAGDDARVPGAIVAVGRLAPLKGFVHLVDACALLRDRGVAFTCDIIGDGPLREDLARRIADRDLVAHVRLLGALEQHDVRRHLARAEVFVLPSVRARDGDQDGIPVALMEAMAMAVPVVTSRLSGIPELVADDKSGLLVEPGDVPGLARAIHRLLRDPFLRERLTVGGREAVTQRHDIARSAAAMHAIFREAIHGA
jgi:glycosyltransferase involved in cell wall biosynthesis